MTSSGQLPQVVVPFSAEGQPQREAIWAWCKRRWEEQGWPVVEAPCEGPWTKAKALTPALERADSEIVVIADADVWCDGVFAAVAQIAHGAAWAIPHELVYRLTQLSTAAVLDGIDWRHEQVEERPYRGIEGGGILVAPRELLLEVPPDARFAGWGQEDECWALALRTLAGEPWRGGLRLVHLWHPPQERWTRNRGSREGWQLRRRYFEARDQPSQMRSLVQQGRYVTDATPVDAVPAH